MRRRKSQPQLKIPTRPLEKCLAKTYKTDSGDQKGHCVLEHCHIVGEVARELLSRFPSAVRQKFFPNGSELVAAAHDVGKVSPTFQEKIYRAAATNSDPFGKNFWRTADGKRDSSSRATSPTI